MSYYNKTLKMYVARGSIDVNRYSFDGTAESVKTNIDDVVARAKMMGMIGEGEFDFSVRQDYYDSYDIEVTYNFTRGENEKEREARERAEAKAKEDAAKKRKVTAEKRKMKKDAEYAEYERLKAKFEGK